MKVGVTGGSGFIAAHVLNELDARGHSPVAFDRHLKRDMGYEFFLGDITREVDTFELMAHIDAFIHLGGVLGTAETIENPRPSVQTNIIGGLNVLEAAARYDIPGVNIAVGNHWMNNTYSITKSTMERFVHMYNKERGTEIAIVRALNAYGPGQASAPPYGPSKVKKIMPSFINSALYGQPISIYGDGKQIMDMIYVEDVANVLVTAMEHTYEIGVPPKVLEAGSGNPTTVNEIAEAVLDCVEPDWREREKDEVSYPRISHTKMRPGEPNNSVVLGDPLTLRGIGIDHTIDFKSLQSGIRDTVAWFKEKKERDAQTGT